jgi:two-component system response regulator NreC
MSCTVAIVDDHALFREGLRAMLAATPDVLVVAEASSTEEALAAVRGKKPQVVVLDLMLPGIGGSGIARELLREDPLRRVLVLSMATDEVHVADALHAGVLGYATKRQSAAEVVDAIRAVSRGERYLAPEVADLAPGAAHRAVPTSLASLTAREREIFGLCVAGLASKEIARQLLISPRTVETHRARILRKLGVRSAVDLVRLAARHGLLPA